MDENERVCVAGRFSLVARLQFRWTGRAGALLAPARPFQSGIHRSRVGDAHQIQMFAALCQKKILRTVRVRYYLRAYAYIMAVHVISLLAIS